MISRRNIRIKVMQTLYSVDSMNGDVKPGEALGILTKKIEQSRQLFTYLVYFVTEVTRYAETDARLKASKHLPTKHDLNINTRIAGNELLWKILEEPGFNAAVSEFKLQNILDNDLIKKLYLQLANSPEYKEYIEMASRDKKSEKDMLEFIFTNLMLPNEDLITHLEENFIHWDDDAEMMNLLVVNFFQKPANHSFKEIMSKEKWEFAKKRNSQTPICKMMRSRAAMRSASQFFSFGFISSMQMSFLSKTVCRRLFANSHFSLLMISPKL